jgi:hypothetical protein
LKDEQSSITRMAFPVLWFIVPMCSGVAAMASDTSRRELVGQRGMLNLAD